MRSLRNWATALVTTTFLAISAGCSGTPSVESSTTEATVKGTVTARGKPVTEGELRFNPTNYMREGVGAPRTRRSRRMATTRSRPPLGRIPSHSRGRACERPTVGLWRSLVRCEAWRERVQCRSACWRGARGGQQGRQAVQSVTKAGRIGKSEAPLRRPRPPGREERDPV